MIHKKTFSVLICIILIMLSGCYRKSTFKTEYIVNEIADTNDLLHNPGKGLVVRGWCDPNYDTAYYEMCSVAYERFEWAAVEPVEGQYDWGLIDRYINEASKHGLKFAFGIMVSSTSMVLKEVIILTYHQSNSKKTI